MSAGWLTARCLRRSTRDKFEVLSQHQEAVAYGDLKGIRCAILNIDPALWRTGPNVTTSPMVPTELAGHPLVYDMVAERCCRGEPLLAEEKVMAGAQIRRFLILHKELDQTMANWTRTQKVRRGFVAERYAALVTALYNGSHEADISTEVTYEDGHKGVIAARVKIRDLPDIWFDGSSGEGA